MVKDELLTIRGFQTQPEKSGKKKVELGEEGITAGNVAGVSWWKCDLNSANGTQERGMFLYASRRSLCSLRREWMLNDCGAISRRLLRKHWSIEATSNSDSVLFCHWLRSHALLFKLLFGLLFISLSFIKVLFIIRSLVMSYQVVWEFIGSWRKFETFEFTFVFDKKSRQHELWQSLWFSNTRLTFRSWSALWTDGRPGRSHLWHTASRRPTALKTKLWRGKAQRIHLIKNWNFLSHPTNWQLAAKCVQEFVFVVNYSVRVAGILQERMNN